MTNERGCGGEGADGELDPSLASSADSLAGRRPSGNSRCCVCQRVGGTLGTDLRGKLEFGILARGWVPHFGYTHPAPPFSLPPNLVRRFGRFGGGGCYESVKISLKPQSGARGAEWQPNGSTNGSQWRGRGEEEGSFRKRPGHRWRSVGRGEGGSEEQCRERNPALGRREGCHRAPAGEGQ